MRKYFSGYGYFVGTVKDVEVQCDKSGQRQFFVEYEDGDAEHLSPRELQRILIKPGAPTVTTSASTTTTAAVSTATTSGSTTTGAVSTAATSASTNTTTTASQKKTRKVKHVRLPDPDHTCYFLLDCETTGSRRNYDRAIEWAIIAYDKSGRLIDTFVRRVNPDGVTVTAAAYNVHGISNTVLKHSPRFVDVVKDLNAFFDRCLDGMSTGALIAHNASTDLQFLYCEYIRVGVELPAKIKYGLCTFQTIKRLKTCYKTADAADWVATTPTDQRYYSVKCCAMYNLSQRDPPELYEVACGRHHEALPDVKTISTFFFDYPIFKDKGLWHAVFKNKRTACWFPLTDVKDRMIEKMSQPVLKLHPPPAGWVLGEKEFDNDLSTSSCSLPAGVREHVEPRFQLPRRSRGAGQVSDDLLRHIGVRTNVNTRSDPIPHTKLMVKLFLYFFTEELLQKIVDYSNAKAKQQCRGWQHNLTVGELIVWIGIVFKMGAIGHNRVCHYWSERDGFGVKKIKAVMTHKRFGHIAAWLTFAPLGTASGWAKIAEVDEYLQRRCRMEASITQHMTVDESMIKVLSKLCPWIVYMPRKPIKLGIKVIIPF